MGHVRDRWKDPNRAGTTLRWQVKYRVDGRETDGGSYANKDVAKRKLVELEANVLHGAWVDPTGSTTVTELMRMDAATRSHSARTAGRLEGSIRVRIEGTHFGSCRLNKVLSGQSDRARCKRG